MRRSPSISICALVLVATISCGSVLFAGSGVSSKQGSETSAQHTQLLRPVPSLIDQVLADAALSRTTEPAVQPMPQIKQQNALDVALLQEVLSGAGRIHLDVLIWSAGWSLGSTMLLLGLVQTGRRKRSVVEQKNAAESDNHHTSKAPLHAAETPLAAAWSGARARATGTPGPNLGTAPTVFSTPGLMRGVLRISGTQNPIDLARRTNRSRGEIDLALHLEELQQLTEHGRGTV
jgi:hypothetical protein